MRQEEAGLNLAFWTKTQALRITTVAGKVSIWATSLQILHPKPGVKPLVQTEHEITNSTNPGVYTLNSRAMQMWLFLQVRKYASPWEVISTFQVILGRHADQTIPLSWPETAGHSERAVVLYCIGKSVLPRTQPVTQELSSSLWKAEYSFGDQGWEYQVLYWISISFEMRLFSTGWGFHTFSHLLPGYQQYNSFF